MQMGYYVGLYLAAIVLPSGLMMWMAAETP